MRHDLGEMQAEGLGTQHPELESALPSCGCGFSPSAPATKFRSLHSPPCCQLCPERGSKSFPKLEPLVRTVGLSPAGTQILADSKGGQRAATPERPLTNRTFTLFLFYLFLKIFIYLFIYSGCTGS